jgi:hypothetical protein
MRRFGDVRFFVAVGVRKCTRSSRLARTIFWQSRDLRLEAFSSQQADPKCKLRKGGEFVIEIRACSYVMEF